MVNLAGRVFVVGGGDGRNYLKEVEEFNTQTFAWKKADEGILFPFNLEVVVNFLAVCHCHELTCDILYSSCLHNTTHDT